MRKYIVRFAGKLKKWLENYLSSETEKLFRKRYKLLSARRRQAQAQDQAECLHIAGCNPLSEEFDSRGRTSIVWHSLNTGEIVGICTNCLRYFFPSDPDYSVWRKRSSFNKISGTGVNSGAWGKKSEPYLNRFTDPPARTDMPPLVIKYAEVEDNDDPWLLNPDGTPDPFSANVDFGMSAAEAKTSEDIPDTPEKSENQEKEGTRCL
jgi:hypothetical protein